MLSLSGPDLAPISAAHVWSKWPDLIKARKVRPLGHRRSASACWSASGAAPPATCRPPQARRLSEPLPGSSIRALPASCQPCARVRAFPLPAKGTRVAVSRGPSRRADRKLLDAARGPHRAAPAGFAAAAGVCPHFPSARQDVSERREPGAPLRGGPGGDGRRSHRTSLCGSASGRKFRTRGSRQHPDRRRHGADAGGNPWKQGR